MRTLIFVSLFASISMADVTTFDGQLTPTFRGEQGARFDGFDEVLVVPILLTVSSHSFDDIPTIIGMKRDVATEATLASEGIECYTPTSKVRIAPLLDFAEVMGENLNRRVSALSRSAAAEGVVLVAYGSTPFDEEWTLFMEQMSEKLRDQAGIESVEFAWCGHIVSYSPEPTAQAIERVLATKDRALIIPVLVAVDEDFQLGMIQVAADRKYEGGEVSYIPDSILPEPYVEAWVERVALEMVAK
ncbi:MAG: cobalamin biosynthesis protein CbiX [Planctomycetota bacterium]|nr:cobalamin biosynthesis protein CbiX [Planctomycetota bacterium]MDG2143086.1 cobalamin biosynthesis protein CbiX [Planctomycetota bacterium]